MTVSMMLSPSARNPSIRITAASASLLSRIRRRVSLSTLTSSADSHLRASSVAEVPAIAMSRMPPASTWVMFGAVVSQHGQERHEILHRLLRIRLVGRQPNRVVG